MMKKTIISEDLTLQDVDVIEKALSKKYKVDVHATTQMKFSEEKGFFAVIEFNSN